MNVSFNFEFVDPFRRLAKTTKISTMEKYILRPEWTQVGIHYQRTVRDNKALDIKNV